MTDQHTKNKPNKHETNNGKNALYCRHEAHIFRQIEIKQPLQRLHGLRCLANAVACNETRLL